MNWELDFIRTIQKFDSEAIIYFFKAMTSLGELYFFLIFLSISWVVAPRKFSINFTFLLLICVLINTIAKEIFARPRPFILHPELQLFPTNGYSFPSGHSQIAVVFWGYLAYSIHNKKVWVISCCLMLCIGISRIYLGVHYPTDVFCGWIIGIVCLLLFIYFQPKAQQFLLRFFNWIAMTIIIISILMTQIFHTELIIPVCGGTVGLALGILLGQHYLKYQLAKTYTQNLIRILITIFGTLFIYIVLKNYLPQLKVLRFFRYMIVVMWMSFLAPRICCYKISSSITEVAHDKK